ncbi:hypothetical protein TRIUR3_21581 [Triticum urartu]|uniref:Uncharacterized protein n=1 Tax=Triticum urartu TaxID=4572 RepID=M7YN71_TRIUA|nr:hypothetical protein TRIUR3_21581 [Triticum urartu]
MELLLHKGHLDASAFAGAAPSKDSNLVRAPEDRLVRSLCMVDDEDTGCRVTLACAGHFAEPCVASIAG